MLEKSQSAYRDIDHLEQIIEQQKVEIKNLNDTVKKTMAVNSGSEEDQKKIVYLSLISSVPANSTHPNP